MGHLRSKAERERTAKAEKAKADREARDRREEDEHKDKVQAVVDFLRDWTGETVLWNEVQPAPKFFSGFHSYATWRVTVDGFDLVVKQEKNETPLRQGDEWKFQIHQVTSGDESRLIRTPGDLLEPLPVEAQPAESPKPGVSGLGGTTNHHREIPGDTGVGRGA